MMHSGGTRKKVEIVEEMISKDFPVNFENRFGNINDFNYIDTHEFKDELEKRNPTTTEEDKRPIDGVHYKGDNQAFVRDEGNTPT